MPENNDVQAPKIAASTGTRTRRRTQQPAETGDTAVESAPASATPRTAPTNVIAALARVQARIGGIQKLTPAERQRLGMSGGSEEGSRGISYAYRGIDQVTAAAQPLFGELGIVIAPGKIISAESKVVYVGANKNEWEHLTLVVRWSIYGPGGIDDMIEAETIGEGRDNSDKTANKAYTGAYKNLMLKLLTIGDPSEDPDNERHENDGPGREDEAERIAREKAETEAHNAALKARQDRLEDAWAKLRDAGAGTPRAALAQRLASARNLALKKQVLWDNEELLAEIEWAVNADSDQVDIKLAEMRGEGEAAAVGNESANPEGVEPGDLDLKQEGK